MNSFFADIGVITWFVLVWLSLYFIINIWIFLWRFFRLSNILNIERESLEAISKNQPPYMDSAFFYLLDSDKKINIEMLRFYKAKTITKITAGLSMLSVISSTAPFIGLFGTVVEILEAFYQLGGEGKVSFDVIAPIISKALVATAFGILTAIPAYSFYIILKRKAFEITTYLDMQINAILGNDDDGKIALK